MTTESRATDNRRQVLRSTARAALAAALGALTAKLLLRGPARASGCCARAGRCGGCPVTHDCDVYQSTHVRSSR